ncbi:hypothetical protein ABT144_30445 [Streptomyces sp. NPDC002039]|uniref:hypothetical protein n=1 Tax=Streptomyces sp. NPDC002039 TaxID=3154660 RepID=UPI0033278F3E
MSAEHPTTPREPATADADPGSGSDARPNAGTDADAGSDARPDAGTGTDAGARPGPDAGSRAVRRLRPGVAVTPLREGLHLRGRRGSVTLEGSKALPTLWRVVEEPLRDGGFEEFLGGLEPGSALRRAVDTLVGQLDAHDLLMADPTPPTPHPTTARTTATGPVGDWLGVTAEDWLGVTAERPDTARAALLGTRAEVVSGAPDGPLARAAGRALAAGGLPVAYTVDPDLPGDRVLLYARGPGPVRGVAVGRRAGRGYATALGSPAQIRSEAEALEARLDRPGPPGAPATQATPAVFATAEVPAVPAAFFALLAGAAAHRLLCGAAGLPDPADEGEDDRLLPGLPAVLLANARPPRADYRNWLGPDLVDADRRGLLPAAATLGEALRRLAALTDDRCGLLPEPLPGDLRQLPVPLAHCVLRRAGHPDGVLVGGAPRLDLARLELFCRAAELLLGGDGFSVGANPGHARGRALRAVAGGLPEPAGGLRAVPADRWSGHPQVRHWWTTLTDRLGVPAHLKVFRVAPGEDVYRAVVRPTGHGEASSAASRVLPLLGDAVEATPGDAAAFAALAAVARVSAPDPTSGFASGSGGAVAPLAAAGVRTAAWEDSGWTGRWLAELAGREEALQDALRRLTGADTAPDAPTAGNTGEPGALLRAFGFTVLRTPRETR